MPLRGILLGREGSVSARISRALYDGHFCVERVGPSL